MIRKLFCMVFFALASLLLASAPAHAQQKTNSKSRSCIAVLGPAALFDLPGASSQIAIANIAAVGIAEKEGRATAFKAKEEWLTTLQSKTGCSKCEAMLYFFFMQSRAFVDENGLITPAAEQAMGRMKKLPDEAIGKWYDALKHRGFYNSRSNIIGFMLQVEELFKGDELDVKAANAMAAKIAALTPEQASNARCREQQGAVMLFMK